MIKTKTKLVDKHTNQAIRIKQPSGFLGKHGWYYVDHPHCSASFVRDANEVWIAEIWVFPEYRSRGLGTAVLAATIEWAGQLPIDLYPVPEQDTDMKRLIRWYERFGFKLERTGVMRRDPNSQTNARCAVGQSRSISGVGSF
jgi:GNAT superfamily N-acetyltransferase